MEGKTTPLHEISSQFHLNVLGQKMKDPSQEPFQIPIQCKEKEKNTEKPSSFPQVHGLWRMTKTEKTRNPYDRGGANEWQKDPTL